MWEVLVSAPGEPRGGRRYDRWIDLCMYGRVDVA